MKSNSTTNIILHFDNEFNLAYFKGCWIIILIFYCFIVSFCIDLYGWHGCWNQYKKTFTPISFFAYVNCLFIKLITVSHTHTHTQTHNKRKRHGTDRFVLIKSYPISILMKFILYNYHDSYEHSSLSSLYK